MMKTIIFSPQVPGEHWWFCPGCWSSENPCSSAPFGAALQRSEAQKTVRLQAGSLEGAWILETFQDNKMVDLNETRCILLVTKNSLKSFAVRKHTFQMHSLIKVPVTSLSHSNLGENLSQTETYFTDVLQSWDLMSLMRTALSITEATRCTDMVVRMRLLKNFYA